jgi:hypothetical protein
MFGGSFIRKWGELFPNNEITSFLGQKKYVAAQRHLSLGKSA